MFNEYVKLVCPVCNENSLLKTFRLHMEKDDIHKEFLNVISEQVFTTLLHSTELKHNANNIYYPWDYYLQTRYDLTEADRKNYKEVVAYLRSEGQTPSHPKIAYYLKKLDPKYSLTKLTMNIIRIIETTC